MIFEPYSPFKRRELALANVAFRNQATLTDVKSLASSRTTLHPLLGKLDRTLISTPPNLRGAMHCISLPTGRGSPQRRGAHVASWGHPRPANGRPLPSPASPASPRLSRAISRPRSFRGPPCTPRTWEVTVRQARARRSQKAQEQQQSGGRRSGRSVGPRAGECAHGAGGSAAVPMELLLAGFVAVGVRGSCTHSLLTWSPLPVLGTGLAKKGEVGGARLPCPPSWRRRHRTRGRPSTSPSPPINYAAHSPRQARRMCGATSAPHPLQPLLSASTRLGREPANEAGRVMCGPSLRG